MDTVTFAEQLSTQGRSLESFGDPQLIALAGGVAVIKDGAVVGAIGVGGLPSGLDDEAIAKAGLARSEEHTSELQSRTNLVCRLLLEKKKKN